MRLQFKKTDLAAVAIVVAAAVLLLLLLPGKESGTNVAVYKDGELIKELSLYSVYTTYLFNLWISFKHINTNR